MKINLSLLIALVSFALVATVQGSESSDKCNCTPNVDIGKALAERGIEAAKVRLNECLQEHPLIAVPEVLKESIRPSCSQYYNQYTNLVTQYHKRYGKK
jgi:hypothetical protein